MKKLLSGSISPRMSCGHCSVGTMVSSSLNAFISYIPVYKMHFQYRYFQCDMLLLNHVLNILRKQLHNHMTERRDYTSVTSSHDFLSTCCTTGHYFPSCINLYAYAQNKQSSEINEKKKLAFLI